MNLRILSARLGLSTTTVSRALAGYDDVSPATRERVREAAQEFGYVPNRTAQRLKAGRSELVALVLPAGLVESADPFYAALMAAIGQALAAYDHDLLVTAAPAGSDEVATLRRLVDGRRVDGVILPRPRLADARARFLLERRFPFVTLGRTDLGEPHFALDVDGALAFRLAVERLVGLGHRRIAMIGGPAELTLSLHRAQGYREGLAGAGIAHDPALTVEGDLTERGGERAASLLLDRDPTALVCVNDRTAMGALQALKARGLVPGRDVSVISYDNVPASAFCDPPLTTIHRPIGTLGARLAALLLDAIRGGEPGPPEILEPTLVVRGSDGPAPAN